MRKKLLNLLAVMILTACASTPPSYLPEGDKPIVNIEANVDALVKVDAKKEKLTLQNKGNDPLTLRYKLFWYDKLGVTQTQDQREKTPWQHLWLAPLQTHQIELDKPTPESEKYRFYLRGEIAPPQYLDRINAPTSGHF
ncbi:hypothetical protein A4G19_02490 [Pasteurellaceae bacterium Macca]|nr:hypothetical protein [Pasteurellaceae bacterium Macca]